MNRAGVHTDRDTAGTLLAGGIIACAALAFFAVHGIATHWDLTHEAWDANWYSRIAASGYHGVHPQKLAFLPGYPLLLAPVVHALGFDLRFLASFLTSSVLSILGGIALFRVLRARCNTATSLLGIALLAFSPFAIYLYNGYSEAAFFLCVSLALLSLQRGRLLLAAGITGYAFLCRPYALALVPLFIPAAWVLVRERNLLKLGGIVALGALPTLLYCAYMQHAFGDPFIGSTTLAQWRRYDSISHAWPYWTRTLYGFHFAFRNNAPGTSALSLIAYFAAVITLLAVGGRIPRRLLAYSLLLLACVYLSDALIPRNLGRHTLLAFGCGPALAAALLPAPNIRGWTQSGRYVACGITLLFFMALFVTTSLRYSMKLWVS